MTTSPAPRASAGHKLGQLIGDWFEKFFVLPLLIDVSNKLELYLDHRFRQIPRPARGRRIRWRDVDGNGVSYDFVMELGGTEDSLGIPVAFIESFWRRGTRHSMDKARDDSGKLMPMRATYPTARFLGIVASGDFTDPAGVLVRSRGIDLFSIPKGKVIDAFAKCGLQIDYDDRSPETEKARLADQVQRNLNEDTQQIVADMLVDLVGLASVNGYADRVRASLSALPQEIRFVARRDSKPRVFETITEADIFLDNPQFDFSVENETFVYQIAYSDGTNFERPVESLQRLRDLHRQMAQLADHITSLQTS